ncbi:MAG: TRAP transporter substrate-binding protein DctP [Rhodospirillales bacterium]|jgi:TRAP-type C4-dicarboxylate transport system substrate-binding protein|nr:TRAP transporter substrate-binding protein DctP [Rhodospirillales bacterium]
MTHGIFGRVSGISLAAALLAGAAANTANAKTTIIFNSFAPPKFVINQGMIDVWAKEIARVTEGRIKVRIPAKSLAPPQQQWEMVTQGVADATYIFNGFARKRLLLPQIGHLPFGTTSARAQGVAMWRAHKKFFEKANEHKGVAFLGYFGSPAAHVFSMTDKPIRAAADLKGVKTWSLPGDQARALAKLGAVIVPGPAVRSYAIISKGIVKAYGGQNHDSIYAFNVAQFAKSATHIDGGMGSAAFSVFMNQKKWDGIPKRDQQLITSVSGEKLAEYGAVWDKRSDASLARMKKEGKITHTLASPAFMAELKKAWKFLDDEWIANAAKRGVDGPAALKFYRQLTRQLVK